VSGVLYLDASAILKLVVEEPESEALRVYLSGRIDRATSVVGVIESRRFARRSRDDAADLVSFVLGGVDIIDLDEVVASRASAVALSTLRTLDAIHLASVLEIGSDLEALVTYDRRLAEAARDMDLPVASPA